MVFHLCERLQHAAWVTAIFSSMVASVVVELAHYFGFFLLVGAIAMVDLRVLRAAARQQDITQLADRLFPLMWAGLGMAVLSGLIMFAGDATTLFPNPVFHVKLVVMLLAVAFGCVVQQNVRKWDRQPAMTTGAKLVALLSLALWIGVILAAVEIPHLTYVP